MLKHTPFEQYEHDYCDTCDKEMLSCDGKIHNDENHKTAIYRCAMIRMALKILNEV